MYYILNLTFGIIMNIIGFIAFLVLLLLGYKPNKHKKFIYFIVGHNWGGVDLGLVAILCEEHTEYMLNHEFGHSIQNAFMGPLFPFLVAIPSVIRYWYREFRERAGKPCKTGYYDIWFEAQASNLGIKY